MSTLANHQTIKCRCGKKYRVRPNLEENSVRCYSCGESIDVPLAARQQSDPFDALRCDKCDTILAPSQTQCLRCTENDPSLSDWDVTDTTNDYVPPVPWFRNRKLAWLAIAAFVIVTTASILQLQMSGPDFLGLYLIVGVLSIGLCLFAKFTDCSTIVGTLVAVAAFEAVGIIRYVYGLSNGMSEFGMMHRMMLFGPMVLFFVSAAEKSGSSGWIIGSSGCGSGCGGGCGGGGCGGCGG